MGFVDWARKQFVDVIEWVEEGDEVLAWRFPVRDLQIQQGAQLTVRTSQAALFVHEGRAADLFGPGQHTIVTRNIPILTDLQHWDKAFQSPFKSDVVFFSTRLRLDQKWGTSTPITVRDAEFGAVRLRAFGIYAFKIASPRTFFERVSGTRETYAVGDLEGQLRGMIVATLTDHFGESGIPFLDLAASQVELGAAIADRVRPLFGDLGLALDSLHVQNVSLPRELQARLDERIGMAIVGDVARYTHFQTARSIPTAAANEGGVAGAGAGLGAGIAMGQAMGQAMSHSVQAAAATTPAPAAPASPQPAAAAALTCARCQARLDRPSRFCPECGAPQG